jgi:hypothetical protein
MYRCIFSGQGTMPSDAVRTVLPNKRLKLPGADRFNGSGVFAPWRTQAFVHCSCAGGRVARSLSAIR